MDARWTSVTGASIGLGIDSEELYWPAYPALDPGNVGGYGGVLIHPSKELCKQQGVDPIEGIRAS